MTAPLPPAVPPPSTEQLETVLREIIARLDALPPAMSEARVRQLVDQALAATFGADPAGTAGFVRRLRFGAPAPGLAGSRYARLGLGRADIEFLHDLQLALQGQRRVSGSGVYPGPSPELRQAFAAVSDAAYVPEPETRQHDQAALEALAARLPAPEREALLVQQRAMDSLESGAGLQLIGAEYVGELWEAARRESRIFGLIEQFEMLHPTVFLPVEVDIPELLYVAESTSSSASEYLTVPTGSQRVSVTAQKLVIHQMWSGELEEDAIIPFVPFLRRQATLALAHYADSLVLNGDMTNAATGNINLDDADPPDTKHYLAVDGLRHVGLIDNTANSANAGGAITYALLRAQLGRMIDATRFVDWGHPADPNDVVYIADPLTADRIAVLPEVITVDKYGPAATVLTGEVLKIGRNPLVASLAMALTKTDGRVSATPANNTRGQVVAFNRRGFRSGWRRRVRLEVERLPGRDQTRLVYSLRLGFGRFTPTGAASGIEAADVLFNITV